MNFPLLKTFKVSSLVSYFLNRKLLEYRNQYDSWDEGNFDKNRYQSNNLLHWDDEEFLEFVRDDLSEIVSNQLGVQKDRFKCHFVHFIDYESGGFMSSHKHSHSEDFVVFIYLKDCKGGKTVFYLNDYDEESSERTLIKLAPKKNLGAIFSSLVEHRGDITEDEKRIFVVGIKLNNTY